MYVLEQPSEEASSQKRVMGKTDSFHNDHIETMLNNDVTVYSSDVCDGSQLCRLALHECGIPDFQAISIDIISKMENVEPW